MYQVYRCIQYVHIRHRQLAPLTTTTREESKQQHHSSKAATLTVASKETIQVSAPALCFAIHSYDTSCHRLLLLLLLLAVTGAI
jgi:hypothetical protein